VSGVPPSAVGVRGELELGNKVCRKIVVRIDSRRLFKMNRRCFVVLGVPMNPGSFVMSDRSSQSHR